MRIFANRHPACLRPAVCEDFWKSPGNTCFKPLIFKGLPLTLWTGFRKCALLPVGKNGLRSFFLN
jgi:hypothetical protein